MEMLKVKYVIIVRSAFSPLGLLIEFLVLLPPPVRTRWFLIGLAFLREAKVARIPKIATPVATEMTMT